MNVTVQSINAVSMDPKLMMMSRAWKMFSKQCVTCTAKELRFSSSRFSRGYIKSGSCEMCQKIFNQIESAENNLDENR